MNVLFPSNPLQPKSVDESFGHEAQAAKEAGFNISRVDLEIILGGEVKLAGIPEKSDFTERDILYRGWLMKPEHYLAIDLKLGRRLISGPQAYEVAYNLPQWYPLFAEDATPRTLIIPGKTFDLDAVAEKVYEEFSSGLNKTDQQRKKEFWDWKMSMNDGFNTAHEPVELMELPGARPVMLKDYLKSAKHAWFDACYMPDCRDRENVKRVAQNFLDIQGDHLTGGLCFRQFINCKRIGIHSKTGQPLVNEWRAFLKHGRVFYLCPYWAEGDYTKGSKPEVAVIESLCAGLKDLPFVAVDLGEMETAPPKAFDTHAGAWTYGIPWVVYEVNDGGSAGVPDGGDVKEFYRVLAKEFA